MQREKRRDFPYVYSRGKKTFHFVVKLKDVPGALGSVLDSMRDRINLLGSVSYNTDDGQAVWSAFGEAVSSREDAGDLRAQLLTSRFVTDCEVTESSEGLIVDSFHTGLQAGQGEAYLMLPRTGLSRVFEQIVKQFGSGGEVLLYEQGLLLGRETAGSFRRMLGPELAKKKVAEMRPLLSAFGWGVPLRVSETDGGDYVLRIEDCFECSSKRESSHGCNFMRGYFEGSASSILGVDIACRETSCRVNGDGHCEFMIGPRA